MDQAENLRNLVQKTSTRARVLTVTSGKGGVGKTNVAVNLAILLSQRGFKVILVDTDIGLANADILLSVQPRYHLGHVLSGEIPVLEALTPTPAGVLLLSGCTGVRHLSDLDTAEREFLTETFQQLAAYADFVIVDTQAGISENVVQFAATSDEILVVTIPEPTAMTDGYAVIKAVARKKGVGRIRLIVNQCQNAAEASGASQRIRAVSKRFLGIEVDCLGEILVDPKVRQSVRQKAPFVIQYPRSAASKCLRDIADKVQVTKRLGSRPGFLRRFAQTLSSVLG